MMAVRIKNLLRNTEMYLEFYMKANKTELPKRREFNRRDIGTYEFEYKEETEICTRSTTSNMDFNTMFAAMMEKFAEVKETSKANNEKLLAEFKVIVQETVLNPTLLSLKPKFKKCLKVADLETNIDKNFRIKAPSFDGTDLGLESVPVNNRNNYDDIMEALQCKYCGDHKKELYPMELRVKVRKTNETLQDFALEIERLLQPTYPGEHHPFLDIFKIL
ncbi:hypothetical protein FF38_11283 [Lucilia cuprina]|uniref:Uncharacterized protein n=1 Tax=Lucilia cuprina TaxID=7375 RepID=A0A0L0BL57_LUCCU|nr:hypothetical protein FF38_11283 [Lucilia cuprina]